MIICGGILGWLDDIQGAIGRRNSERRINMRTKMAARKQSTPDDDSDLETYLQSYSDRATRFVYRAYDTTQARKGEGKQILTGWLKHGVGVTARGFLGPRQSSAKSTVKVKIANPAVKLKTTKTKRRK